jgi:hypothetical protein
MNKVNLTFKIVDLKELSEKVKGPKIESKAENNKV